MSLPVRLQVVLVNGWFKIYELLCCRCWNPCKSWPKTPISARPAFWIAGIAPTLIDLLLGEGGLANQDSN